MPTKPTLPPSQAFNDVLARMMQAEVNEGGRPPATPCDTPVEIISPIHMADPEAEFPGNEEAVEMTKPELEKMLTEHLADLPGKS